jgi:uncharacterized protein (DUF362 family)
VGEASGRSRVVFVGATYQTFVDVIESLINRLVIKRRGKLILLKPNMLEAWKPERAVTKHPAIVEAVIHSLERRFPVLPLPLFHFLSNK